jgi:hypothetical protein
VSRLINELVEVALRSDEKIVQLVKKAQVAAAAAPQITNEIHNTLGNIETLIVQQGYVSASQTVTLTSLKDVAGLIEALGQKPEEIPVDGPRRAILDACVASLRAQLALPAPSKTAISEVLQTIRHLGEGMVAHYLASKFGIHVDALIRSLGF